MSDHDKRVTQVFLTTNSNQANAVADERRARGERIIEHWRKDGIAVLKFENMTEAEISDYLDEHVR